MTEAQFAAVMDRFDKMDARFDSLEAKVDALHGEVGELRKYTLAGPRRP